MLVLYRLGGGGGGGGHSHNGGSRILTSMRPPGPKIMGPGAGGPDLGGPPFSHDTGQCCEREVNLER